MEREQGSGVAGELPERTAALVDAVLVAVASTKQGPGKRSAHERRPACPRAEGPEAIAAIDVLRADVDSPTRVVEPGQDIIERDEDWVRACRQAIEAIIAST